MSSAPVTVVVYMRARPGGDDQLRANCEAVAKLIEDEPGALGCAYSFGDGEAVAREDYVDAQAALGHLARAQEYEESTMAAAELTCVEAHGPKSELDRLREPFAALSAHFYETEFSSRK